MSLGGQLEAGKGPDLQPGGAQAFSLRDPGLGPYDNQLYLKIMTLSLT